MLREVMDYYGVHRDFRHAGYFATEAQQPLSTALKAAMKQGQMNHPAASCEVSNPRWRTAMAPPVWRGNTRLSCGCPPCEH